MPVADVSPFGKDFPFVVVAVAVGVPRHDSVPFWRPVHPILTISAVTICRKVGLALRVHKGLCGLIILVLEFLLVSLVEDCAGSSLGVRTAARKGFTTVTGIGERLPSHLGVRPSAKVSHFDDYYN